MNVRISFILRLLRCTSQILNCGTIENVVFKFLGKRCAIRQLRIHLDLNPSNSMHSVFSRRIRTIDSLWLFVETHLDNCGISIVARTVLQEFEHEACGHIRAHSTQVKHLIPLDMRRFRSRILERNIQLNTALTSSVLGTVSDKCALLVTFNFSLRWIVIGQ